MHAFIRPLVYYQSCERDILNTNEPIFCKLAQVINVTEDETINFVCHEVKGQGHTTLTLEIWRPAWWRSSIFF